MSKQGSSTVSNYLSLVKFSHTIFAMPFALMGFFLAVKVSGKPVSWSLLGLVVLCMVFARSAAMAFNRFIDRHIDSANTRTAVREIPSGIIHANAALIFVVVNSLLFMTTTYFINKMCFYLSPIALLIILGYSYTKRFTFLCHLVLGLGLSLAPIGAFLAVAGEFQLLPVLYSVAVLFWVGGFDIIYALQDEDFDRSQQLRSVPVAMGKSNALVFSSALHFITFSMIVMAGLMASFGLWYWIGTGIFSFLLVYQHTLVKSDDLSKVNVAFFTTNGVASLLFAVFFLLELYV